MNRIRYYIEFTYGSVLGVIIGLSLLASAVMTVRNMTDAANGNVSSSPLVFITLAIFLSGLAAGATAQRTRSILASIFVGAMLCLPFIGGILLSRGNYTIPREIEVKGSPVFEEVTTRELDCSLFNLLDGKYKVTFPNNAAFAADDSSVLMALALGPTVLAVDNYGDFGTEAILSGQEFVIPFVSDGQLSGQLEIGNCSSVIVYRYMRIHVFEIEVFPDLEPEQIPEPTAPPDPPEFEGIQT